MRIYGILKCKSIIGLFHKTKEWVNSRAALWLMKANSIHSPFPEEKHSIRDMTKWENCTVLLQCWFYLKQVVAHKASSVCVCVCACMHTRAQVCLTLRDTVEPTRLLCPWNSPCKNTGASCHFLLQGIFPTQRLNLGLLHHRQMFYLWVTGEAPNIIVRLYKTQQWGDGSTALWIYPLSELYYTGASFGFSTFNRFWEHDV